MPAPAQIRLSKSKFMVGLQCLKRLYLQVHRPDLVEVATPDAGQVARLEQGQEVGLLAQRAFPGGVTVGFDTGLDDALAKTAALLQDTSVPAIFEATFRHANVVVRVDILQRRRPNSRWRLIEVKSCVTPKEHYLPKSQSSVISSPNAVWMFPRHV